MLLRTTGTLFVSALTALTGFAQTPISGSSEQASSSPDVLLTDWRAEHGAPWQLLSNPITGTMEMLHGGNAASPFEPSTNRPADWFALGRFWVNQTLDMHLVDGAELVDSRFRYLPLGQINTNDKITVRFDQVIDGVPVENGAINVLFDTQGRLLSVHSTAAPAVDNPGAKATIDAGFANLIAARAFADEFGVEPTTQGNEKLTYAWVDGGETRRWTLAWQVEAMFEAPGQTPIGRKYTIDANGRNVLKSTSTVHNFDVTGTISSNATVGLEADRAANPPAPVPMPRVRVQSSAGTVETDRDGNFNIAGVNTPLDLTVSYFGQFTNVNNDAGADYTITFPNVQPNQANSLLMNPSPSQNLTSQANAQLHINVLRDWIRDRFPTDSTADFRAVANVNLNDNCNAFYNGSSVNFFTSGGGCNNTAFTTVVAHEMGHWLNVRYGTGNGGDGIGEGNADVFAMYVYDDPVVGRFFTTGGGNIRTGTNNRQFCGDTNPGCYGGVHADGQVWMGAAWKVRTNLNNTLGNAMGDMAADMLFLGWMNSYNQTTIRSIMETQWLTLDDNDGNITNGTPNYNAIDSGFRTQGFPGYDLQLIGLTNVTELPDVPTSSSAFTVSAEATSTIGASIASVEVFWRQGPGSFVSNVMSNVGGDVYSGSFSGPPAPAFVQYYVEATDDQGNTATFPEGGADDPISFRIGTITPILVADFESGPQGFTSGGPGDNATTGIWTNGDPIGTAAQPENDHTNPGVNCWFTGQGAAGGNLGANDVDGGRTSLLSPIFDASGAASVSVEYWRWYSNDQGGAPNADTFRVDVSTNGGTSWTNVETVGPGGDETGGGWLQSELELASVVTPTATMRLRFVAEDGGTGSIVEAAIDDVSVFITELGVPPPVTYCNANVNSTGFAARISAIGSQSVAANNMLIQADRLPVGTFGLFFFGDQQTQQPVNGGSGNLCVAGNIQRLPVVQSNVFGQAFIQLDFTSPATNASIIVGGSTWNFQLWFRDAPNGVLTSNNTNGVQIEFAD